MNAEKPHKRYGKRSVRFWVALYFTVGVVIHRLAYILILRHATGNAASTGYGY